MSWAVAVQSDGLNSALSPVVYGDIALSINTHYITIVTMSFKILPGLFLGFHKV